MTVHPLFLTIHPLFVRKKVLCDMISNVKTYQKEDYANGKERKKEINVQKNKQGYLFSGIVVRAGDIGLLSFLLFSARGTIRI